MLFKGGGYTAEGEFIGTISHVFLKILVAVIEPKATLKVGDTIRITGQGSKSSKKAKIDFTQPVESMQLNHEPIVEANPGDGEIGLQVCQEVLEKIGLKASPQVLERCCVYKIHPP